MRWTRRAGGCGGWIVAAGLAGVFVAVPARALPEDPRPKLCEAGREAVPVIAAPTAAPAGSTVTIDGSRTDVRITTADCKTEHRPLTKYAWSLEARPPGSTAALQQAGTLKPRLTLDKPGEYRVRMSTCADGCGVRATPSDRTITIAALGTSDQMVGLGIGDVTGPIAEVGMVGYGNSKQVAAGIHTRLYARAFLFGDGAGGSQRLAIVIVDLWGIDQSIKADVIRGLKDRRIEGLDDDNVMLLATHDHAGPGGFTRYNLYTMTAGGYVAQSHDAVVSGIVAALRRADAKMARTTVRYASQRLIVGGNRSLVAFNADPDRTPDPVDPIMHMLRFDGADGKTRGVLTFHAVHNTGLSQSNLLVSADHKGMAAWMMERSNGSEAPFFHYGEYIAGFANSDEGDVSPWAVSPRPADDMTATIELARREADFAGTLARTGSFTTLATALDHRHSYVDMAALEVADTTFVNGEGKKRLCAPSYGFSFAAGAEDGPGLAGFWEGMKLPQEGRRFDLLKVDFGGLLLAEIAINMDGYLPALPDPCALPKPPLIKPEIIGRFVRLLPNINGGFLGNPLAPWAPRVLPLQIFRIGSLAVVGVPAEPTTMAGKRLRDAVQAELQPAGIAQVVIGGLANSYSGYITTPEEYDKQQYEGASTLFGRLTLEGYRQELVRVARALKQGTPAATQPAPTPPRPEDLISVQTGVVYDSPTFTRNYGHALERPGDSYSTGDTVVASFVAGHPKNDLRSEGSFLWVERKQPDGSWATFATDSSPWTTMQWKRGMPDGFQDLVCTAPAGCSFVRIRWKIDPSVGSGTYRIRYTGDHKTAAGADAHEGKTAEFAVKQLVKEAPLPAVGVPVQ